MTKGQILEGSYYHGMKVNDFTKALRESTAASDSTPLSSVAEWI